MVNPLNGASGPNSVDRIVQRLSDTAKAPPPDAVTIDVLRLMELHLQRRGLIPEAVGTTFRYLWFIAETERNIFLWRNSLSIEDARHFEFWVSVPALIKKRLAKLEIGGEENPFVNPLWGTAHGPGSSETEKNYLEIFLEIYERSSKHAHAISSMTRMIYRELGRETAELVPVTIPRAKPVEQ